MEDKKLICKALAQTLKLTSNQEDLLDLVYTILPNGDERVIVMWMNGASKNVNVTMDSGTAMIRDIMKAID